MDYGEANWPPPVSKMIKRIQLRIKEYLNKNHTIRCLPIVALQHIENICDEETEVSFLRKELWDLPGVEVIHTGYADHHEFEMLLYGTRWDKASGSNADISIVMQLHSDDRIKITKQDIWN